MKRIILLIIAILAGTTVYSQTVVQMVEDLGVYKVPCEINGLKVKMVFDTGAATVSISSLLAEMMLDNGYLSVEDFGNKAKSITADGRIVEHTRVILRNITIGTITISNVDAIVVGNQQAPLLLGQSAIQKLGDVSIKGDRLYITGTPPSSSSSDLYERWDARVYSYSNYTYGFGWKLPNDIEWKREQGQEIHTPFRAVGGPFLVFVNAHVTDGYSDLWTILPKLTQMVEEAAIEIEKKTGLMVYERTWEKCSLLGQHAIKTTFKEYFKDSRYNKAIETFVEEYYLIHNGFILIVAAKVDKEFYNQVDCCDFIKRVFQGFYFNIGK